MHVAKGLSSFREEYLDKGVNPVDLGAQKQECCEVGGFIEIRAPASRVGRLNGGDQVCSALPDRRHTLDRLPATAYQRRVKRLEKPA